MLGGSAIAHRARELRACPAVASSYRSGRLGTAKVRLLVRAREAHPTLFTEHETALVDQVAPLTVDQASKVIGRWEALAAATADAVRGDDPPEDPAIHNSLFASETLGGRVVLDGDLDPVAGAEVRNAIDAEVDRLFNDGTYRSDDGVLRLATPERVHVPLTRHGRKVPASIDWSAEPEGRPPPVPPPLPVRVRFQAAAGTAT